MIVIRVRWEVSYRFAVDDGLTRRRVDHLRNVLVDDLRLLVDNRRGLVNNLRLLVNNLWLLVNDLWLLVNHRSGLIRINRGSRLGGRCRQDADSKTHG